MPSERYVADSHFTGVFRQVAGGWIGLFETRPGAHDHGATEEDAPDSLGQAIRFVLEAARELTRLESQRRAAAPGRRLG